MAESPSKKNSLPGLINISNLLAVLIALLSITTAYAAYQSAAIDSTSTDNYFAAQDLLNDANTEYVERGQEIIYDFLTYNSYIQNKDQDQELAEYYYDQLSDEAIASEKRVKGPFDQQYYDQMYKDANALTKEQIETFNSAGYDSNRAVAYQLTVLIMAVGLSFAAWASLVEKQKGIKVVFTALSVAAFILGLVQMLTITPPL